MKSSLSEIMENKYSFDNKFLDKLLNITVFLISFPFVDILGNSLYFYFLLLVLFATYKITGRIILTSRLNTVLFTFLFFSLISSLFHPILYRDPGIIQKISIYFHFIYWFVITLYFSSWIKFINIYRIAKWISIGLILQIFTYYFFKFNLSLSFFVNISTDMTRNSFVFNVLAFSGLFIYYFKFKYGNFGIIISSFFIFSALLLSNGRAGALLGFILFVFYIFQLFKGKFKVLLTLFIIIFSLFFIYTFNNIDNTYTSKFAAKIEKLNPRLASLIIGEGEGNLSIDKSWLMRKLMIDKTIEIVDKHPYFGIGLGNFKNYSADLETLSEYDNLQGIDMEIINSMSSHNSYALIISETGIIGFIIFISILIPLVFLFIKIVLLNINSNYLPLLFSFILILIHMYSISTITGANFWFIIGIIEGLRLLQKDKYDKNIIHRK